MAQRVLRRRVELDPAQATPAQNYRFLCSFVAPRPVAWVTTVSPSGLVNAAPFSWYNAVCSDPPMVMLAVSDHRDGRAKDTTRNILDTGEFVVNLATREMAGPMVATSGDYPPDVSEPEALGLATAPSAKVRPPRLQDSPAHLECRLHQRLKLGRARDLNLVLGEVVHAHADDAVLDPDGTIGHDKAELVARMGGSWYCSTQPPFAIERPRATGGRSKPAA